MSGVATAVGGAAVLGGGLSAAGSIGGALLGGSAQTSAAGNADAAQLAMYNNTVNNLSPFMQGGSTAFTKAQTQANNGFNFNPTNAQLQQTPGYQFNLQQGEMAAQNSAASRGLGVSGQSVIGAEQYASGLASNTYQQQFGNALSQYQTNFGNQLNLANIGENAAAMVGNQATATGQGIAQNTIGAGNAIAGAAMGASNGITNAANNYANYNLLQGIYGSQNSGAMPDSSFNSYLDNINLGSS